jgi:hypothetical protein
VDAKQYCFKLQRVGAAVHWLRDDGLSGTVRWPRLFRQFFRFDKWILCRG